MKTVMYMAVSVNGMTSTWDDETPWSKEEFEAFYKFAKNTGNVIMGRKTYDMMVSDGSLKKLSGITVVVLTHSSIDGQITAKTPQAIIKIIQKLGMETALVCGGTKTNSTFLKSKLVDELILDVEPIIIGEGKNLIEGINKNIKLELIKKKNISKDSIQLRYKILK